MHGFMHRNSENLYSSSSYDTCWRFIQISLLAFATETAWQEDARRWERSESSQWASLTQSDWSNYHPPPLTNSFMETMIWLVGCQHQRGCHDCVLRCSSSGGKRPRFKTAQPRIKICWKEICLAINPKHPGRKCFWQVAMVTTTPTTTTISGHLISHLISTMGI